MDQNSTSPDTGNSCGGGASTVLYSLGTGMIFAIFLSLYYFFIYCRYGICLLHPRRWANQRAIAFHTAGLNHDGVVIGIEEETLDSIPKMLYSDKVCQSFNSAEGNELNEAEDNKCCSICLSDYKESEVVRIIPHCGHMFDIHCIDKWLRQQATCPICRTSPLPSSSTIFPALESAPTTILPALDHESIRPFPV